MHGCTSLCLDGLHYNSSHWYVFLMFVHVEELLHLFQAPCFFGIIFSPVSLKEYIEHMHSKGLKVYVCVRVCTPQGGT